jgi:hypothetical protein
MRLNALSLPRRGALALALCVLATLAAHADGPGGRGGFGGPDRAGRDGRPGFVLDGRYHHDHYYPQPGWAVRGLPLNSLSVVFGSGRLYFNAGVWYQPRGAGFVVITPPVGVVLPILPQAAVTLWVGGQPCYYANGVYYRPLPDQGYEVIEAPADASPVPPTVVAPSTASASTSGGSSTPRANPELILYPRQGQSAALTQADRQACMQWASTQAGADRDPSVFQRGLAACLDARGYTVR